MPRRTDHSLPSSSRIGAAVLVSALFAGAPQARAQQPQDLAAAAPASSTTASAGGARAIVAKSPWKSLFDGRTLAGWHSLGYAGAAIQNWNVVHGTIHKVHLPKGAVAADGQPLEGADLISDGTYGDFELEWEWRITPGGNSGVKYNVSEGLSMLDEPRHAAKGFEYQVLDDDRHPDGHLPTHRAGALYDLVAPNAAKQLKPVGEWNSSRIVFVGNHGEHWLNGRKVVEYDLGTPAMDSALARSKYRTMPWFAVRRHGHVVLQDHGDEVFYRNIRIREITAAQP